MFGINRRIDMEMPSLTKEEINKADFFSVPEEYADQVVECMIDSMDVDDLVDYVKASFRERFIKSKTAFRQSCHSYEEIWGESDNE